MRCIFGRNSVSVGVMAVFLICGSFIATGRAPGAEPPPPVYTSENPASSFVIGQPQAVFQLNEDDMPAVPGSLFSTSQDDCNILTITGGTVSGQVFGGIATADGDSADENEVTITGGQIGRTGTAYGNVTGGWSFRGGVNDNTVDIANAVVRQIVFGGWIRGGSGGDADGNVVSIGEGSELGSNLYGGYSQGNGGKVQNNKVEISDGMLRATDGIIAGGYSALSPNEISGNEVTITGGTIRDSRIYGGRGQSTSAIHDNAVTIDGGIVYGSVYGGQSINGTADINKNKVVIADGTVTATIYGGQAGGKGAVTGNAVDITGGTVTGDIYGGYTNTGTATGNIVTIGGTAKLGAGSNLIGGFAKAGGDAFTGNILNKTSDSASANEARNFEKVNFNYTGEAGIGFLSTTATGSDRTGVTLSVDGGNEIEFDGAVGGTGNLTKTGTGTLAFTNQAGNLFFGGLDITGGTVAIDNANQLTVGAGKAVTLRDGTTLRFDADVVLDASRSIVIDAENGAGTFDTNGYTARMDHFDARSGDMVKTGDGTLIMTGDGSVVRDGEVQVSKGTLQIGDGQNAGYIAAGDGFVLATDTTLAYNQADPVTETQAITGGGKVVQRGSGTLTLTGGASNDFTGGTEIESGTIIIADNGSYSQADGTTAGTSAGYITFTGNDVGEKKSVVDNAGSADVIQLTNSFRTATGAGSGNTVDLTAGPAAITGVDIAGDGGAFFVADGTTMNVDADVLMLTGNTAAGKSNDLYVGDGGTFNLRAGQTAMFNSGIGAGERKTGTLNISSATDAGSDVYFVNSTDASTFAMGKTIVDGTNGNFLNLNLVRLDDNKRVVFENEQFTVTGGGSRMNPTTVLGGDGIIRATDEIKITNALLLPYNTMLDSGKGSPGTLTLDAGATGKVTLDDFTLGYVVVGDQTSLNVGTDGVAYHNNSLLDFGSSETITMTDGIVAFVTSGGTSVTPNGDYLIMRSMKGFAGIDGDTELNRRLTAYVNGVPLTASNQSPRGGYEFKFGGDNDVEDVGNNVWFTQDLNSLTMDWTGGGNYGAPVSWLGDADNLFSSLQTTSLHEKRFMTGDKVYISGSSGIRVDPVLSPSGDVGKITVSGLVVGQNASGSVKDADVTYFIRGGGGITADKDSAFGEYAESADDAAGHLEATGKLEKHGAGNLIFENTGGNLFTDGVELHGGTVTISRADQLEVGDDKKITFVDNASLRSSGIVALDTPMEIASGKTATLMANNPGHGLLLSGQIAGNTDKSSSIRKTGNGVVQIAKTSDDNAPTDLSSTTVEDGTFRIVDDIVYENANAFTLSSGATLAGKGTVKADNITISGNLSPDGDTFKETHMAVAAGEIYETLTLEGNTITLEDFTMDFDVGANSNGKDDNKDLLTVTSGNAITFNGTNNTINFIGTLNSNTEYLIVDGDGAGGYDNVNGNNLNTVLKAKLNNRDLSTQGGPRGHLEFAFGDKSAASNMAETSIWLVNNANSLSLDWTGGADTWTTEAPLFSSLQVENNKRDDHFVAGDKVYVSGSSGILVDSAMTVSGLVVGQNTSGTDSASDVYFSGNGGITADKTSAFGKYTEVGAADRLDATGKLQKYGAGDLIFENAGGNLFTEGVELHDGAVEINRANQFAMDSGAKIAFVDNAELRSAGVVSLDSDVTIESGKTAELSAKENTHGLLLNGNITGDNSIIRKTGTGVVQIGQALTGANLSSTTVEAGTFRIVGDYENANDFTLSPGAALAGKGTVKAGNITISGNLSPDAATFEETHMAVAANEIYETLTLEGNTITLDGFTMDFDVGADSNGNDDNKDLLTVTGATSIANGTINFRGHLDSGTDYLVISGDTANYTLTNGDPDLNQSLKATLNGADLTTTGQPRGHLGFQFGGDADPNGSPTKQGKSIWLANSLNSLTMNWTGGSADWGHSATFNSLQTEGGTHTTIFQPGDEVALSANGSDSIAIRLADGYLAEVSQLVVGAEARWDGAARTWNDDPGTVIITGDGSIKADGVDAYGRYTGGAGDTPNLENFGMLVKRGSGTLAFRNEGGNYFTGGVELYGGTIDIARADQLEVGDDKKITFKESATLRSSGIVALDTPIVVESGKATLMANNAGHALLLNGEISGTGAYSIRKTGESGVVQIAKAPTSLSSTDVEAGIFRIVDNIGYKNANYFTLSSEATLAGKGTIKADTGNITISGNLSPDGDTFTETDGNNTLAVNNDLRYGTLTLDGGMIDLDDFTMDFDVGADSTGKDDNKDLLAVTSDAAIALNGTINFLGTLKSDTNYLVIDRLGTGTAGYTLTNNNLNESLTATLNGQSLSLEGGPRGHLEFQYGDDAGSLVGDTFSATNNNVWLTSSLNSLTMNRTGSGLFWNDGGIESLQDDSGVRTETLQSGDEVLLYNPASGKDAAITVTLATDLQSKSALNVTLSQLTVGAKADNTHDNSTPGIIQNGDVTIDGSGSITTNKDLAFGEYTDENLSGYTKLENLGKLSKYGTGTLTFKNEGSNTFLGGIDLYDGVLAFGRGDQLYTSGKEIAFKKNDDAPTRIEALADLTLAEKVVIDDGMTAEFAAAPGTVFTYTGNMTDMAGHESSRPGVFSKMGAGTVLLSSTSTSGFTGEVNVGEGTLVVDADYGATTALRVESGGTLSGSGTLGSGTGTIKGTLRPGSLEFGSVPEEKALTIKGDLSFEAGSILDVSIAQFGDSMSEPAHASEGGEYGSYVSVDDGAVTIDPNAQLKVTVNYWGDSFKYGEFYTIIDAENGTVNNYGETFGTDITGLFRGQYVGSEDQGWGADEISDHENWYQIGIRYDKSKGFEKIPDGTHNQTEIGKIIDNVVANEPGNPDLGNVIDRLDDQDDDKVRKTLDQLTGDLIPNALFLALKEPWRHPFNRLGFEQAPRSRSGEPESGFGRPQIWAEFTARHENADHDGNAHGFRIRREGLAIGVDRRFSPALILGANFQYTNPRLTQSTGTVDADDFEFGAYGLFRLAGGIDAKAYLGYSRQRYDFRRTVSLPASASYNTPLHELLKGRAGGHALSASVEATKTFHARPGIRLLPVAAVDFEKAWMNGFRETGGVSALGYDNAATERTMLRVGLNSEFDVRNVFTLKARLQAAAQIAGKRQPSADVRFVAAKAPGPAADIRGSRIGRAYVNLGVGGEWKVGGRDNMALYANYDAKLYRRATIHAGEVGLAITW